SDGNLISQKKNLIGHRPMLNNLAKNSQNLWPKFNVNWPGQLKFFGLYDRWPKGQIYVLH
ncbi:10847_t:CDS:2, partial [Racocetra fulgida]